MNEKFVNNTGHIIIDDSGITCHIEMFNQHIFYPYGSMTELKVGFFGLSIKAGKYSSSYAPVDNQKQKLKQLLPTLQNLNAKAPKCEPVIIDMSAMAEVKIEKTVESISSFFGGFDNKHAQMWNDCVSNIVNSMGTDEEILHGFRGSLLHINGGRESVTGYIGLITNRRFYYAGSEGKAVLTYLKTGTIELKDVHAITLGVQTLSFPAYVQFEVKNDDYKLGTYNDTKVIKEKLEAGIIACESAASTPTIVQAAVSAADELKKFKELLDMGVITQEEFDAKKKQLLGL